MICKFCGNEIDDNSEFCFVCGQQVSARPESPADGNGPDAPVPPQESETPEPLPVSEPLDAASYADVDPKDVQKAGRFARFVSFVCPLIGFIFYAVYTKRGETGKKHSIANAAMSGVCMYLALGILAVVKKSMF